MLTAKTVLTKAPNIDVVILAKWWFNFIACFAHSG